MMSPEALKSDVTKLYQVDLSDEIAAKLLAWLSRFLDETTRINLTGLRNPELAYRGLLLDSLAFILHAKDSGTWEQEIQVCDLGTGGGIPSLPMAICQPNWTVTAVDGTGKKIAAIERMAADLVIPNLRPRQGRLSEMTRAFTELDRAFDLVTARAVAPLDKLAREAVTALKPGTGVLCAWKSKDLDEEEELLGNREATRRRYRRLDDLHYDAYKPCRLVRYQRT